MNGGLLQSNVWRNWNAPRPPLGGQGNMASTAKSQYLMNRYGYELDLLGGRYASPIAQKEALYRTQISDPFLAQTAVPTMTRMGAAAMAAGPMPLEKEAQAPWYHRLQSFSFPIR